MSESRQSPLSSAHEAAARGARVAVVGGGITAAGTVGLGALAWQLQSFAVLGAAAHVAAGSLVWLGLWVWFSRRARAEEESRELARLAALSEEGRESLFEAAAGVQDAQQALARFEQRGFVGFAVGLALVELGLAAWVRGTGQGWLERAAEGGAVAELGAAAGLCAVAFVFLLLGRYAYALESRGGVEGAGGGGRRATAAAVACFVAGLAQAGQVTFEVARVDALGWAFVGVGVALGLEALLLLLLEAYRPRRAGERPRPAFDSRLLGLLAAPGDVARSIQRAVDYQFGFSLSQTWFYRFMERWVVPIVGFALACFWLLSSLVVVPPHAKGLSWRLGELQQDALMEPGFHLKFPWPIDTVELVATERLHEFNTSDLAHADLDDHHDEDDDEDEEDAGILWTDEAHGGETEGEDLYGDRSDILLLIPRHVQGEVNEDDAPVNLLSTAVSFTYRIADPVAYATRVEDPRALLRVLAERELSFLLSAADLDQLMLDRRRWGEALRARLQEAVDRYGVGIEVVRAGITELNPPHPTAEAFEAVTAAEEEREAAILEAQAAAARSGPLSDMEAARILREAEVEAAGRLARAEARAARFVGLRALDRAAPGVFRLSRLLDALVEGSAGARKLVVTGAAEYDVNVAEKVSADDLGLGDMFDEPAEEE